MASVVFAVPAMYADHHVVEVRRILHDVPGVRVVYASSAFGVVEIDFDADQTSAEELQRRLDETGYRSPLPTPRESGEPASGGPTTDGDFRRRTTSSAPTGAAIAFRQETGPAASEPEPTQTTEE